MACNVSLEPDLRVQLCEDCRGRIRGTELAFRCRGCGAAFRHDIGAAERCRFCKDLQMAFASVTCLGNYDSLLRDLVVRMKSSAGHDVAIQLGLLLGKEIVASRPRGPEALSIDLVVPTPSHWTRQWRRGHNVAALLTESICRAPEFRGKCRAILAMKRKTRKQGTLTMKQRFQNVKDCFVICGRQDVNGMRLLLVDDVMTSGATAIEAATVLRRAGASEVHLAIVARGVGRNS